MSSAKREAAKRAAKRALQAVRVVLKQDAAMANTGTGPRCSDSIFGYGIGTCCGCNRFPVVLYKNPHADRWRCEGCYVKDNGVQPMNQVST